MANTYTTPKRHITAIQDEVDYQTGVGAVSISGTVAAGANLQTAVRAILGILTRPEQTNPTTGYPLAGLTRTQPALRRISGYSITGTYNTAAKAYQVCNSLLDGFILWYNSDPVIRLALSQIYDGTLKSLTRADATTIAHCYAISNAIVDCLDELELCTQT